jgi:hypothetical protein
VRKGTTLFSVEERQQPTKRSAAGKPDVTMHRWSHIFNEGLLR